MLLFLILLLPLFLSVYCFKVRTQKVVPVIFIGAFSAVLVVAFKMLFIMSHRVVPYSFVHNYFYFLLKETLLPAGILYGLYFLISKDNVEFKINTYLPLQLSFYAVYLPYCVISTTSSVYSWYSIFLKPVVFAIMIAQTGVSIRDLYRNVVAGKKGKMVLNIFMLIVFFAVPPVLETVYLLNYRFYVLLSVSAVYLILPVVIFYFTKKLHK